MKARARGTSEFLRFSVVGTIGFAVDASVLYACAPFAGWLFGRLISFISAASTTWWLNRRHTFAAHSNALTATQTGLEYLRYLVSMLAGGAVNYACYASTLYWLDGPGTALIGVAMGSVAGLGVNFSLARLVVFKRSKATL
jgi:putative flippase GtrA